MDTTYWAQLFTDAIAAWAVLVTFGVINRVRNAVQGESPDDHARRRQDGERAQMWHARITDIYDLTGFRFLTLAIVLAIISYISGSTNPALPYVLGALGAVLIVSIAALVGVEKFGRQPGIPPRFPRIRHLSLFVLAVHFFMFAMTLHVTQVQV